MYFASILGRDCGAQLILFGMVVACFMLFGSKHKGYLFSTLAVVIGVVAFLFLECINYIEHYGLRRFKTEFGRYERVQPYHSWNSNFNVGRITLYELTRHSDHHYKSSKKYQILNSHQECPSLPFGYPASILSVSYTHLTLPTIYSV